MFLCRFREEGRVRMEILIFLHVSEEQKYWNILTCLKPKYFLSHDIKNTVYYEGTLVFGIIKAVLFAK